MDLEELLPLLVERRVDIIGEAARGVSDAFQVVHAEIPWRRIMSQRHVLAHDYGDIEDDKLWRVATVYVPELIRLLESLIPPPPLLPPSTATGTG